MELSSFWSRYPLAQSQISKAPDRDLIVQCKTTIYGFFNKVININKCIYLSQDPI